MKKIFYTEEETVGNWCHTLERGRYLRKIFNDLPPYIRSSIDDLESSYEDEEIVQARRYVDTTKLQTTVDQRIKKIRCSKWSGNGRTQTREWAFVVSGS